MGEELLAEIGEKGSHAMRVRKKRKAYPGRSVLEVGIAEGSPGLPTVCSSAMMLARWVAKNSCKTGRGSSASSMYSSSNTCLMKRNKRL
jgi:hypothetical protein